MLRLAVYHWLPIAHNMLPDIRDELSANGCEILPSTTGTEITYKAWSSPKTGSQHSIFGRINDRGFAQHVQALPSASTDDLQGVIDELGAETTDLLYAVLPEAVKNKLAVLDEGVVSFDRFPTEDFKISIEKPCKHALATYRLVAVVLDKTCQGAMQSGGIRLDRYSAELPQTTADRATAFNVTNDLVLFYSTSYPSEGLIPFDEDLYQLCALHEFGDFLRRAVEILKATREHVIPVRRRLVVALQHNTTEDFDLLTALKKYLTYVNIKLPVLEKMKGHLEQARRGPQFEEKVAMLQSNPVALQGGLTLEPFQPQTLLVQIHEDMQRLSYLLVEDTNEVKVLSNEAAEVLDGTLMSEDVHIAARRLDTAQASLELDRISKNRANALKLLSVVVSLNTVLAFTNLTSLDEWLQILLGFVVVGLAYLGIEYLIDRRASLFRLVIPVKEEVHAGKFAETLATKKFKRQEGNGSRRVKTWSEKLRILYEDAASLLLTFSEDAKDVGKKLDVDITVDYDKAGYLHGLTLEIEHGNETFASGHLVAQALEIVLADQPDARKQILPQVFAQLGLEFERALPGITRLLVATNDEVESLLGIGDDPTPDDALSKADVKLRQMVASNKNPYGDWFRAARRNLRLTRLIGKSNLQDRTDRIEKVKEMPADVTGGI